MNFTKLKNRMHNQLVIDKRLKVVCLWYLLFLMISVRKHSLRAAADFSGLATSQFSRLLKNHPNVAVYNLDQLSKKQAKQFSAVLKPLAKGQLPWTVAMLIDSTIEHRCSLHTDNVNRFNHGKGFQIGHQWTNVVLIINDKLIPLKPIPFYTKSYCREHNLKYQTENALVVQYIDQINLQDYIGAHQPEQVVVLADSGYDDRKIQNAIIKKNGILSLPSTKGAALKAKNII